MEDDEMKCSTDSLQTNVIFSVTSLTSGLYARL